MLVMMRLFFQHADGYGSFKNCERERILFRWIKISSHDVNTASVNSHPPSNKTDESVVEEFN